MRLIARLPDKEQVGALVDALRNGGFDRKDMIISEMYEAREHRKRDPREMAEVKAYVKTERDGLWEAGAFTDGIEGLQPGKGGIVVAVETPKHEADRVRSMMKQYGAIDIVQD